MRMTSAVLYVRVSCLLVFGLLTVPSWGQDRSTGAGNGSESTSTASDEEKEESEAAQQAEDLPESPWALTVYGAVNTKEKVGWALVPPTDLNLSYGLVAGAVSRRMTTVFGRADIELEGQVVKHFGSGSGEINGLAIGRWIQFPWNHRLPTTIALGLGISHATSIPVFEALTHENTAQWLTYVMFEATVTHPDQRHWAFTYRIHHRSGFFGAFNGVRGASNALGFGVKYRW